MRCLKEYMTKGTTYALTKALPQWERWATRTPTREQVNDYVLAAATLVLVATDHPDLSLEEHDRYIELADRLMERTETPLLNAQLRRRRHPPQQATLLETMP